MNDANNIYYLFSTAAQSIAAFIGLLVAGYTLVLSMMDATAREDETLADVYDELKRQFHRDLTLLSIVTAAGILGCLIVIFFNKETYWWFPLLATFVFLLVIASMTGGVLFVITIINPAKYQVVAKQLAREIESPSQVSDSVSRGRFLELFIDIEQLVRRIWQHRTDIQRLGQRKGMPSFREMLEVLFSHGLIAQGLYSQLMNISKHRNVIVHGQVDFVNSEVFQEAELARCSLNEMADTLLQAREPATAPDVAS